MHGAFVNVERARYTYAHDGNHSIYTHVAFAT
ncbi:hypothetical protein CFELI_01260 [Corynebacterium felinum]|uniref:Uncharacterized protein n=1 Tax=Corynebacterium felinum TaxID=131318 RepID=A0ABU2B7E3_9CORY|nr:hypothetical protein [Corynebacterium felinum]WJY93900.1 hypothetical protein CFELI_01260 [Corynebacterium felinum]